VTDVAPPRSRLSRAAAPVAALVILAVGLAIIDPLPVGVFYDDAMYVVLAKALATGHGYRWLNLPGTPPATHFPPGYPVFLAAIWRAIPNFPANVLAFKAANAVLLALAGAGMALFARRRFGFSSLAAAVLAVAGCAVIPMLALSSLVLSEPLFLALVIPILLFGERVIEGERRVRDLVVLGLLAGIATLVRTHGIALVAGAVTALLVRPPASDGASVARRSPRRRLRDAALVGACAVAVMLPWQLWVGANQGFVPASMRGLYESYASWLARGLGAEGVGLLWRTLVRTSLETAGMFATLATPLLFSWARLVTLIALAALLVAGARRSWRTAPLTTLFLAAYSAIVMLWPYTPARFIWGVWPFIVLVVALGAAEIKSWAPRRPAPIAARAILLACSLFVAVGYARYNVRGYRGRWWSTVARSQSANIRPVVAWARSHTRPQDVIASNMEPTVYLYSGRLAVPVGAFSVRDYFRPATVAEAEAALRQILAAYQVDHVVVGSDTLRAAALSMASGASPELELKGMMASGLVFAPAASSRISSRQSAKP